MNRKTAKKILQKVKKDYNKIASEFDQTRKRDWEEFEKLLPYLKDNQKMVDLGCGNGRFFRFLKKHKKIKYTGIDISENLLKEAKKAFPKAKFISGDLLDIPIKEKVDTVVSIASLHHIPSKKLRQKAVKEMGGILKKDGILMIMVWNLFQPKYKKYIWKARIKSLLSLGKYDMRDTFIPWGKTGVDRYYYAFESEELKNLLIRNGFEVLEEKTGNNLSFICKKKK